MRYLLDTNICIYIMKNNPPNVRTRFKTLDFGDIGISTVTAAELFYGVENSPYAEQNRVLLYQFLAPLIQVTFEEKDAPVYGSIRTYLKKSGQMIGANDLFIAAQCLSRGLILVTNNTGEFARVPDIRLENWVC
jgi:tRNA(fMet)-specific endonuclease VapC